jgi:alginate O-acetyltransferase complex protein AlgJ
MAASNSESGSTVVNTRTSAGITPGYSRVFAIVSLLLLSSFFEPSVLSTAASNTEFRRSGDLIGAFAAFRKAAGDRVFGLTLVGSDGWLFLAKRTTMQDYQHSVGLRTEVLLELQTQLDRLDADLRKEGRTLLVVVPPDKASIYPQYMPPEIPVFPRASRLDDLVVMMQSHGTTRIVDLRAALIAASATHQVYYRTDSHWNDLGAYHAYVEIMNALSADDPRLEPHPLADFQERIGGSANRELARIMGLRDLVEPGLELMPEFPSGTETVTTPLPEVEDMWVTTSQNAGLPRLLVFRDSFYFWLSKFVEPHFSRTTVVHYNRLGDGTSMNDWIGRAAPTIVIIEVVEDSLEQILPALESRP